MRSRNFEQLIENFGLCFREFGFVPMGSGLPQQFVPLGDDSSVFRKGHPEYAERLVDALGGTFLDNVDRVAVVGDGRSDGRFLDNLSELLDKKGVKAPIEGHFRSDDDDVASLEVISGRLEVHESWDSVANSVEGFLRGGRYPFVFSDIDRTLIFPRGLDDELYFSLRETCIFDFISRFRKTAFFGGEREQISRLVNYVTETFEDYSNREQQKTSFQNEEAVAAVVLMLATGLLKNEEYSPSARLDALCGGALERAEVGGWLSSMPLAEDRLSSCDGESQWDRGALINQMLEISAGIDNNQAVLVSGLREVEGKLVSEGIASGSTITWNLALLEIFSKNRAITGVFMSDRPAISLGVSLREDQAGVEGAFVDALFERMR